MGSLRPGPPPLPTLPLAPLMKKAQFDAYADLGAVVGATRTAVQAAADRGLTLARADCWAIALGLHPVQVWPEYRLMREEPMKEKVRVIAESYVNGNRTWCREHVRSWKLRRSDIVALVRELHDSYGWDWEKALDAVEWLVS